MSTYSHNPYLATVLPQTTKKAAYPPRDEDEEQGMMMDPVASGLSDGDNSDAEGECGMAVWGREDSKLELGGAQIPFYRYDATFRSSLEGRVAAADCVRLFAGQLPYHMPPSAVMWLLWAVTGVHVVKVEKIIRWKKNRQPCGCFHVYCLPRDEPALLAANELALIDGDGVWVAESAQQVEELRAFCRSLARSKELRASAMPYQLVTLQPARSTYARPAAARRPAAAFPSAAAADDVRVCFAPPPYYAQQH